MPLLDLEFPYGDGGRFLCSLPAERILLHHTAPPAVANLAEQIQLCLNSPLDFPALSQAVLADDRIVIALDDQTPGASMLVRGIWDVFDAAGIDPAAVTLMRPGKTAESDFSDPRSQLPPAVAEQMRLMIHGANPENQFAYLASTTSGERIYLAREVIDADFVLCAGSIAHDSLLGYRGTHSVLYPGLSTEDTIRKSRGQGHDELGPDDVRGLRQTIDEVGWLLGVQFALQVVPAGNGGVAQVIAGASDAVFHRGKEWVSDHWTIELDERPETVVVAVDATAEGHGWEAIGAALGTARQMVSRDGRIIVLSQVAAPLSAGLEMIRDSRTPRDALQPLRLSVPEDVVAATQIAKAADWASVYLLSQAKDDLVEDLFMNPLSGSEECQRLLSSCESAAFVESAQHAHVRLRGPL